ncbi:MAG: hypothetical protein IJW97_07545 [Clostridia bacterium]|nr:hypothetical protein [Clostridia bacterium]
MKRRKEIWPRVWMALLLWVLLGRAVVMPSFAAEEASPVGSADTDTFGEGYEEEAGEATESEEPDYSMEIESGDVVINSHLAGFFQKLEEERAAAEAAAAETEKLTGELKEAVDEAKDAIENAAGSFEDGTEWWRTADGWLAWLKDEGAAVIVGVFSILGTIYIGISPILNKVVKSGQRFEGATATADAVAAQTEEMRRQYEEQMEAMRRENEAQREQFNAGLEQARAAAAAAEARCEAMLAAMTEQYASVQEDVRNMYRREGELARMIAVGFGENAELVRRGSAAKIVQIGKAVEDEQGTKA